MVTRRRASSSLLRGMDFSSPVPAVPTVPIQMSSIQNKCSHCPSMDRLTRFFLGYRYENEFNNVQDVFELQVRS